MEFFRSFSFTGGDASTAAAPSAEPPAAAPLPPTEEPTRAPPAAPLAAVDAPSLSSDEIKVLQETANFAEYGQVQERVLKYMRWRRDQAVSENPAIAPSAEMASDARLMRFLIAKGFDCRGAAEMYIDALRWRREVGIDAYRDAIVAANAPFFTQGAPVLSATCLHPRDHTLAQIQPCTYAKPSIDGLGQELLLDRQGNLIYIDCPGLISPADVIGFGVAEYTAASHTAQEMLMLLLDELSRRQGRLALTLRIIDMSEVRMVKFMQSKQEKEGERIVKEARKPFADAYPTTTYKNFLINLPAAAGAAAPLIKAVVPARSAKKIVLLGSKFVDELHKEAEAQMLPNMLGGVLDDGNQWQRRKK